MNLTPNHRRRWRSFLSACFVGAFAFPMGAGQAQELNGLSTNNPPELSLEELINIRVDSVVGASKYEQKVTRAPASVNIVTSDEIKKFGYRSLADVFRSTPGLYVTDDRNYSFLGFRGFSQPGDFNTGILLLIDGHRVNDAIYNLMYIANEAVLDVDMIDRVEIIRGPSSSIYGNSAFFGVINVLTKRGGQIDGSEASIEGGSFETFKGTFTFGKQFTNDVEIVLSGSYFSSDGQDRLFYQEYANPQNNNGFAVNSDEETAYHLFGSLSYHDFILSAAYSDRYKHVPTAPSGTAFNSGEGHTEDARGYVDLKYEHEFENDLTLMGRGSYDWYPYYAVYPYTNSAALPPLILNQDLSLGQWARSEVQVTKKVFDRHTLIIGAEYQENLRQHQANYDQNPYTSYLDVDHNSRNYAFYTQGEFTLCKPLLLNAGVRYDHFESFGSAVNPRIGLIYSPWEKTTFKALYGQAFRAPNDYELNFASGTFERNPGLQPETIRTYELVYEQYLPAHLRFSASGYHYDINGLISETTDLRNGLSVFRNLQQVQANGLELQIEGRFANGILARASYALQRAEDTNTKLELSNSPRHLAKLNLSAPIYREKLFSSIEVQYNGSVITPARKTANDFALVNWTLFSQKLVQGMELSASVYNLLDARYSVSSSGNTLQDTIQQNGRSFRVKLTYKF